MNITSLDYNIKQAMLYVYTKKYGYYRELKPFGDDAVNFMKSTGLLKTGCAMDAETFGATKLLIRSMGIFFNKVDLVKYKLRLLMKNSVKKYSN